jgi:integrase
VFGGTISLSRVRLWIAALDPNREARPYPSVDPQWFRAPDRRAAFGVRVASCASRSSAERTELAAGKVIPAKTTGSPYQLRHSFATEALAAGVSIFELARVMGASVRTIDRHYGHLARDSEGAIRARLNARAGRSGDVVATGEGD